jgi:DNA-binding HxlR family transcriptional regulator
VIRDLLTGAKRFTDLMDRLGGITPKTLSQRLRELEDAGIVTADREPGRREVWYRLTPAGADLGPVLDALSRWGLQHAWRRPLPGEPLHAEHLLRSATQAIDLAAGDHEPARWHFRLDGADYLVENDGRRWSLTAGAPPARADVTITGTTPSPDRPHLRRVRHQHRHHRRNRASPAIPATDQHHGHRRTARLNRSRGTGGHPRHTLRTACSVCKRPSGRTPVPIAPIRQGADCNLLITTLTSSPAKASAIPSLRR